jgi:hypothetical protein
MWRKVETPVNMPQAREPLAQPCLCLIAWRARQALAHADVPCVLPADCTRSAVPSGFTVSPELCAREAAAKAACDGANTALEIPSLQGCHMSARFTPETSADGRGAVECLVMMSA